MYARQPFSCPLFQETITVAARALKTKKVSAAVLEEIRRMITSGEIKEGDRFPSQNEFAAQLGVSRPSLREAFQVLSQLGAIEQRPRTGTILVSRTPALFSTDISADEARSQISTGSCSTQPARGMICSCSS